MVNILKGIRLRISHKLNDILLGFRRKILEELHIWSFNY